MKKVLNIDLIVCTFKSQWHYETVFLEFSQSVALSMNDVKSELWIFLLIERSTSKTEKQI